MTAIGRSLRRTGIAHVNGDAGAERIVAGLGDPMGHERSSHLVVGLVLDQFADDVLLEGGRAGHWSDLGGADEAVAVVGQRLPQDEVGEAEVGEQVPLADEAVQPLVIGHLIHVASHGPTIPRMAFRVRRPLLAEWGVPVQLT